MEPSIVHVTPNEEIINLFHSWDDTKTKKKLRSFNRAKSWFSKLLKCPFPGLPQGHNRRHIDDNNAIEHMLEALRSGVSFMDYIKLSLVQSENVAVATIHCEPDCSQCKEADAIGDATVTTALDIIPEETRVASATVVAAAEVPERAPVCKLLWAAKACTVQDCKRSHPTPCKDPKCWEIDEDLPRWKAIGCQMFHGGRKTKKSKGNPHKVSSLKSKSFHGSRPQTKGPTGLPAPWPQTLNQPWNQVNQVGNYQAAWTPLSRDGNNQWGNGMMPYNLVARGLSPMLPSQFEQELMALVKRVLV